MTNSFFLKFAKSFIKRYPQLNAFIIWLFGTRTLMIVARTKNIRIKNNPVFLDFISDNKVIRISKEHFVYGMDIINSFDYYFSAVQPILFPHFSLVDYSSPRYHDVYGYEKHPIFFPSFSEPLCTTKQYLNFAKLETNSVAIDLGAYSGLTSIIFQEVIGPKGVVIAVEADDQNLIAINKNLSLYKNITGNQIKLIFGAVWIHNDGLEFSSEGNMGSSAASILGKHRGLVKKVPSFTLSSIASKFDLKKVDFIKCDVEGAEAVIFEDKIFFEKYKPRIIIETHMVGGKETTDKCISDLEAYGYKCKRIHQIGVTLPLIECYPI